MYLYNVISYCIIIIIIIIIVIVIIIITIIIIINLLEESSSHGGQNGLAAGQQAIDQSSEPNLDWLLVYPYIRDINGILVGY